MPKTEQGFWVPEIFANGWRVFNSQTRCLLVSGPSLSGKSHVCTNKIIRHLWDVEGAKVAFFAKTIKTSKEAGTWNLLVSSKMNEWVKSGIGINFTTKTSNGNPGPKVDGSSRTPFFRVRNRWGGESACYLFSLEHVEEIEDKIKEQAFSMIYFSELDKFNNRKVLSVSLPRLRIGRYSEQIWMADTNPAEDGDKSWIYEVFYLERTMDYEKYVEYCRVRERNPLPQEAFEMFQKQLELIEMFPEDNPFLPPQQLQELKTTYAYDPELYDRYVLGKWVFGFGDASRHFRKHFQNRHIIGQCEGLDEAKWEIAYPSKSCFDLITGWDVGDGVNHAFHAIDAVPYNGKLTFVVLDEHESVGKPLSTEQFTQEVMVKVNRIERMSGHPLDLERAWSDNSLFKFSSHADTYPYLTVAAASGGRIQLQAMDQVDKSVRIRVQLVKQLLSQNRLLVSAHCVGTIRMLRDLKRGAGSEFVVQDENKHLFDSLTYALIKECSEELASLIYQPPTMNVGQRQESDIISV